MIKIIQRHTMTVSVSEAVSPASFAATPTSMIANTRHPTTNPTFRPDLASHRLSAIPIYQAIELLKQGSNTVRGKETKERIGVYVEDEE